MEIENAENVRKQGEMVRSIGSKNLRSLLST